VFKSVAPLQIHKFKNQASAALSLSLTHQSWFMNQILFVWRVFRAAGHRASVGQCLARL
jgi:hypothetical protein